MDQPPQQAGGVVNAHRLGKAENGHMRDLIWLTTCGLVPTERMFIVPDAVLTADVAAALDRLAEHGYDWKTSSEAGDSAVWPEPKVAQLCDCISDGKSFIETGRAMNISHNAVAGKIKRIRDSYGWQGQ